MSNWQRFATEPRQPAKATREERRREAPDTASADDEPPDFGPRGATSRSGLPLISTRPARLSGVSVAA